MIAAKVKMNPGERKAAEAEAKSRGKQLVTEEFCRRHVAMNASIVVLSLISLLMPTHDPLSKGQPLVIGGLFGAVLYSSLKNLRRVQREGPFEVDIPGAHMTPEQKALNKQIGTRLLLAVLWLVTSMILLISLPIPWHLRDILFYANMAATIIPFMAYGYAVQREFKRLGSKVTPAAQASSGTTQEAAQAAALSSPGQRHWWTQSSLREEAQQINRAGQDR